MAEIVETPFFFDSEITPAGQIADIVAYITCARYAGRRSDPRFEALFTAFRDLTHNVASEDPSDPWKMWGFSALGIGQQENDEPE